MSDAAAACLASSFMVADLSSVTGPFFLGFMLESFGMGVVFVLSADYLLSVASRRKLASESSRRLGVALVVVTMTISAAQTLVDLVRGFRIFGTNYMNIAKFLSADPLFFASPFLGILSAFIAQLFLLRRIVRFLSSLELLWPFLSRKIIKITFTTIMIASMVLAAVAGSIASAQVSGTNGLSTLAFVDTMGSREFRLYSGIWLGTAVGVDCILCSILCVELWWARRKLSMNGTSMQEFMTRLILITFHGGAAVTGLQVAVLLLYYYRQNTAWCYFPMTLLPKVYNITLILSISLPQSQAGRPPSQISLPTIQPDLAANDFRIGSPTNSSGIFDGRHGNVHGHGLGHGRHVIFRSDGSGGVTPAGDDLKKDLDAEKEGGKEKRAGTPGNGARLSQIVRTSWKQNQGLLSWSLIPGDMAEPEMEERGRWGKKVDEDMYTARTPRPASAPQPRRPSLLPLLDSPSSSSPSPYSRSNSGSGAGRIVSLGPGGLGGSDAQAVTSPLTRSFTLPLAPSPRVDRFDLSTASSSTSTQSRNRIDSIPSRLFDRSPIPYPNMVYSPTPRGSTSSNGPGKLQRHQSGSGASPTGHQHRRSTAPDIHDPHTAIASGSGSSSGHGYVLPMPKLASGPDAGMAFHFDTVNPFASVYSSGSQVSLNPTIGGGGSIGRSGGAGRGAMGMYPPVNASGSEVPLVPSDSRAEVGGGGGGSGWTPPGTTRERPGRLSVRIDQSPRTGTGGARMVTPPRSVSTGKGGKKKEQRDDGDDDEAEDQVDDEAYLGPKSRGGAERQRNMSFQDFLGAGPSELDPGPGGSRSRSDGGGMGLGAGAGAGAKRIWGSISGQGGQGGQGAGGQGGRWGR